jgi:hypothetical protein
VSSTKIRKEVYNASMFGPHTNDDDHIMFYWCKENNASVAFDYIKCKQMYVRAWVTITVHILHVFIK